MDDLDEPGEGGDSGGVGFAGNGGFGSGVHEDGGGGVLVEWRVWGIGDADEVALLGEFFEEVEDFDALA
ncbi:MAG: hypothetical protein RI897_2192 [Verrucomicrobiota bacterium]